MIEIKKHEAVIAIVCVTVIAGALVFGLGEYQSFTKRLGLGESNLGNLQAEGQAEIVTKITSETKTTVTATVSNPEGIEDLSCQNLQDIINGFTHEIEISLTRTTTCCLDNGERYYRYGGGLDPAPVLLLPIYLDIYQIKGCEGKGYTINEPVPEWIRTKDTEEEPEDSPEDQPNVRASGSPVLSSNTNIFGVTLINSGTQSDSVISVSTVVNGTRYTAYITSETAVLGGGGSLDLASTFTGATFTSGTSYQIRIAFASGNQLSLQAISNGGGVQNQASQSSIAIETVTFSGSTATVYFRNVGSVSITPALLTVQGMSSNVGFTGTSTNSTNLTSGSLAKGAGGSNAMTLSGLAAGDVVTFKITTTAGTFAQGTYTVP